MSLILEALRKLEREKQAPERGVVVVGSAAFSRPRGERRLLLFLLGLALGGGAFAIAMLRRPAAAPAPPVAQAALPTPAPPPAAAVTTLARRSEAAPPPSTAPATAPASAEPGSAAPAFTLQAISEREGRPIAVVNERLLREGDSIDGARIVRIAKDEVELEHRGRRLLLRF